MVKEDIPLEEIFIQSSKKITQEEILAYRGVIKRKEIHEAQNARKDFYYVDTGYFGNFKSKGNPSGKKLFHRVVKNELQKSTIENFPSQRWDQLVKMDKRLKWPGWKKQGRNILLVLPNPKSCAFFHYEMQDWYNKTLKTLKDNTDRPIVERIKGSRGERHTNSIYDALDQDVYAVVTFNSIAAMEAIAYGVPAFVEVSCAASPLAENNLARIENPVYPDADLIQQHCRSLAYGQFTIDEINDGTAYKIINKLI